MKITKISITNSTPLSQIAFGIGSVNECTDLFPILDHCRKNGVIPNITVNGTDIKGEIAQKLANVVGAIAVSHYSDNLCFNAVKALSDAGAKQVNIHKLLCKETYESCFKLIDSVRSDDRLVKMKAIVFLLLKPKGDRNTFHSIDNLNDYQKLMDYARERGINIGMDSCSAPMALRTLPSECIPSVEGCESGLFSIYVDVEGFVFPCSFSPGTPKWKTGIDMKNINDFKDIWYHERIAEWRNGLLKSADGCTSCATQKHCRNCQLFDITICKEKLIKIGE